MARSLDVLWHLTLWLAAALATAYVVYSGLLYAIRKPRSGV
ncbi:MAG: hypothetical protein ACK4SY_09700 [Pyrobaculum sp.]